MKQVPPPAYPMRCLLISGFSQDDTVLPPGQHSDPLLRIEKLPSRQFETPLQ